MKKQDLEKYRKGETKQDEDKLTRSVLLYQRHQDFLEKNRLNLSKLVRDFLEDLMKQK